MADFSLFDPGTWFGGQGWFDGTGSSASTDTSFSGGGNSKLTGSASPDYSVDWSSLTMPRQVESPSPGSPSSFDFTGSNAGSGADTSFFSSLLPNNVFGPDKTSSGPNTDSVMFQNGGKPGATDTPEATKGILASLGLSNVPTADLLKAGLGGAGLLYTALSGSPSSGAEKQIESLATQQRDQGALLQSYLNNGTLPPGAQQMVDKQVAEQQTAIRSKYASLGMSGSSAEMAELNSVKENATSQIFKMAASLLETGVSQTNASAPLYKYLVDAQKSDDDRMSAAIKNFVASLGGSGQSKAAA